MNELLHDRGCATCERVRRQRRRAFVERWAPAAALVLLVALMCLGSWLTR